MKIKEYVILLIFSPQNVFTSMQLEPLMTCVVVFWAPPYSPP